jgi:hypothetical protein
MVAQSAEALRGGGWTEPGLQALWRILLSESLDLRAVSLFHTGKGAAPSLRQRHGSFFKKQ